MRFSTHALHATVMLLMLACGRPAAASPWLRETVVSSGDIGRYTSCKVSSTGLVHVSYQDATNLQVGYVRKSGAVWGPVETPDFTLGSGTSTSLALTAGSEEPRISYLGPGPVWARAIRYASKSGIVWTSEDARGADFHEETSLAFSPIGGVPGIAHHWVDFFGNTGGDCRIASKPGGTWVNTIVHSVPYISDSGTRVSLAYDSAGTSHVAFKAWVTGTGQYWLSYRAGSAATEYLLGLGSGPSSVSLALDAAGAPQVAFTDGNAGGSLRYARKSGSVWSYEIVDASPTQLQAASLSLDSAGQPRVCYYDGASGNLKYATRSAPSVWVTETVDAVGDVGQYCSLALDSGGRPHISYYDATNGDLKHAWQEQVPCGPGSGCVAPPNLMKAWWPFNESLGQAVNIAAPSGGLTNGILLGGASRVPGKVGTALQCVSPAQFASIANNASLDVGTGDFSIDAWVNASPGSASGVRTIVDKRSGSTSCGVGYAFFLYQNIPSVQIGDGTCHANFLGTSAPIDDGQWHHVAVTVRRGATDGGRVWVDGVRTLTFDPTVRPGSLNNTGPLLIGQRQSFSLANSFDGLIDEVEIWKRAIDSTEVVALWQAGSAGKCTEVCHVPGMLTYDAGQSSPSVSGQATIWNYSATAQTYTWTLTPVPTTGTCTFPATVPNLSGGPVTIPPGGSAPVNYTIPYPTGLTFGQNACYQFTVTNTVSGNCFSCVGHTQYAFVVSCCYTMQTLRANSGLQVAFDVSNTSRAFMEAQVRVRERAGDGTSTSVLALNGLRPGEPWTGSYGIPPGGRVEVAVYADALDHDPFAVHSLVLELLGDDGVSYQELAEAPIVTALGEETSAPRPQLDPVRDLRILSGRATGTAHVGFTLDASADLRVQVLDAGGRLVRVLAQGALPSGPHVLAWNGRDDTGRTVRAGIYFIHLDGPAHRHSVKVVRLH